MNHFIHIHKDSNLFHMKNICYTHQGISYQYVMCQVLYSDLGTENRYNIALPALQTKHRRILFHLGPQYQGFHGFVSHCPEGVLIISGGAKEEKIGKKRFGRIFSILE